MFNSNIHYLAAILLFLVFFILVYSSCFDLILFFSKWKFYIFNYCLFHSKLTVSGKFIRPTSFFFSKPQKREKFTRSKLSKFLLFCEAEQSFFVVYIYGLILLIYVIVPLEAIFFYCRCTSVKFPVFLITCDIYIYIYILNIILFVRVQI